MKKSNVSEWHIRFTDILHVETAYEDNAYHFLWSGVLLFTLNLFYKAKQLSKLIIWKYWSGYVRLCV